MAFDRAFHCGDASAESVVLLPSVEALPLLCIPVVLTVAPPLPPESWVLKLLTGRSSPPAPPGPAVASASAPALKAGGVTVGAELETNVGSGSGVIPPEVALAAAIPSADPPKAIELATSAEPTMRTSCFNPKHLSDLGPTALFSDVPAISDVKDDLTLRMTGRPPATHPPMGST